MVSKKNPRFARNKADWCGIIRIELTRFASVPSLLETVLFDPSKLEKICVAWGLKRE